MAFDDFDDVYDETFDADDEDYDFEADDDLVDDVLSHLEIDYGDDYFLDIGDELEFTASLYDD